MIAFLRGTLIAKQRDSIVLDVNGVGYRVAMAGGSLSDMPAAGTEVQILTYLQVREDAFSLFGFTSQEEKDLFEKLISVSGVGPKVALSALSTYDSEKLQKAIVAQDVTAIQRISGVGKKMASRIVLELKDSFEGVSDDDLFGVSALAASAKKDATEALLSMGFSAAESELALKGAPEDANETVLLQYALKRLGD